MIIPKITLVGAGPGDPELITLKGLKAIQSADVLLYDALVNPVLLKEASESSLKIFVGKRAGKHSASQDNINLMLVQYAYSHGHVVRLKGGDSFVFGRGHEEMAFAQSFNIPVRIVPGISSCIAIPELQEVPLTRRGVNESFWVMTATTRYGKLSQDIKIAAKSTATVVILMGLRKLKAITKCFLAEGKGKTPIMVIQNGSTDKEKMALGTVDNIVEVVKKANLGTPAIIVIGDVVALHPDLKEKILVKSKTFRPYEQSKSALSRIF